VSVVIPARDRPGQLRACLEALAGSDLPRSAFEVVVVDDGGRVPLDALVRSFESRLAVSLRRQEGSGPACARNTGARLASGELLAFVDDDCLPSPSWLGELARACRSTPHCLVGGRTVNALESNLCAGASQLLIDYLFGYFNSEPEGARFLTSNNMAVPRQGYLEIGGMDESFPRAAAEDRDLCDRWRAKGWPVAFAPNAVVSHAHRMTFAGFLRQHFNYGRGAWLYHHLRRLRSGLSLRVEPASFYRNLAAYPFRLGHCRQRAAISALLFLAQVANTVGYGVEGLCAFSRGASSPPAEPSSRAPASPAALVVSATAHADGGLEGRTEVARPRTQRTRLTGQTHESEGE